MRSKVLRQKLTACRWGSWLDREASRVGLTLTAAGLAVLLGVSGSAVYAEDQALGEAKPGRSTSAKEEASDAGFGWSHQVVMPKSGYRLFLKPLEDPIPMGRIHQWLLLIKSSSGELAPGLDVKIDGGMPSHGHGLPTRPQVRALNASGYYEIDGLQFNMPGQWQLRVSIAPPVADTAAISVHLD